MIDENLKDKLTKEQALDLAEALALDEALEGQAQVARLVAELPESEPSLTWRSALNVRLMAASAAKRRRVTLGWVTGVLATAATAFVVLTLVPRTPSGDDGLVPTRPGRPVARGVEESLISAHREADLESGMGVSWSQSSTDNGSGSL